MANAESFYPARPPGIPADLAVPSARYRWQVGVVLLGLMLFFVFYVALVVGSAYLCYWSVTYPIRTVNRGTGAVKVALITSSALLFLFLLKNFFKRQKADKSLQVEITEEEQPELFAFVRQLCEETGAPFPHRIFVSPEVNAAVFYNSSIVSLFWPTPKNLLIGLGLVNVLSLSEFKAVLAHEFGHFSQNSMKIGGYVYVANRIIADIVYGRDWLDDWLSRLKGVDIRIAIFVWLFYGVLWVLRKVLEGCFRAINFLHSALSRQMEFNADLVAVSVSGSDSLIHALARLDFANESLMGALQDLSAAADHRLYSRDIFYHQNHAATYLRKLRKNTLLGETPALPADSQQKSQVFQPGDTGVPLMWATHPSNYDREQNAKRVYIRSIQDERSPWILFQDAPGVRRKITWKFYRMALKVPKDTKLASPDAVQSFIDDEHAETTYDERYHGLYDGRYVEPGDIRDLLQTAHAETWPVDMVSNVHARLYDEELSKWMKKHDERLQEHEMLSGLQQGEGKLKGKDFEFRGARYRFADVKKLVKKIDHELKEDRKWLGALDRKVFLVHLQMARQLGQEVAQRLEERYRFHLGVQEILHNLTLQQSQVVAALQFLSSNRELSREQFQGVLAVFREAHGVLSSSLSSARQLLLPELKNMQAGQPLNTFLLEKRLVYELLPNEETVKGEWVGKFMEQLGTVQDKARRIHFKSLGGILALQEKISQDWREMTRAAPLVQPVRSDESSARSESRS